MNQRELEVLNQYKDEVRILKADNERLRRAAAHRQIADHEKDLTILWLRQRLAKKNPGDEAATNPQPALTVSSDTYEVMGAAVQQ